VTSDLAASAAAEWSALVTTAVLGAERHPLPAAVEGWDRWPGDADAAVALLDRAAAVVVARRAGAVAAPPPPRPLPEAPPDIRPPCSAECARRLGRIVGGEHDILLGEWLHLCDQMGMQLPAPLLPALLLRGRRRPDLDQVVRRLAGPRAAWLAQAVPELGVKPTPVASAKAVAPLAPVPPPPHGGAAVVLILTQLRDGRATWAALPQLQQLVAGLTPDELASFVASVGQQSATALTARTSAALTDLAEFRTEMLREFAAAASPRTPNTAALRTPPDPTPPDPTGDPS
jgi:hypothetical protein